MQSTLDRTGVPRTAPGSIDRPRLLAMLDDGAPLHVLRGPAGTGKTTLLVQHVTSLVGADLAVVWVNITQDSATPAGFWVRVLAELHQRGLLTDALLYRETAALADAREPAVEPVRRTVEATGRQVVLVLDGFGGGGQPWDAVCQDLLLLAAQVPMLRCLVAGRTPTLLEGPTAGTAVETRLLRAPDLELTADEAHGLVRASGIQLDPTVAEALATRHVGHPVAELRYFLALLAQITDAADRGAARGRPLVAADVERLLPAALGDDLAARVGDPQVLERLGRVALAPYVDTDLARSLLGGEDPGPLLDVLERQGLGTWAPLDDGSPAFWLSDYVRAAARTRYVATHGSQARAALAEVARWLMTGREDPVLAVDHALRAGDLDYAEHLVVRAFPTLVQDPGPVVRLLEATPMSRVRPHPFLTLLYALWLNTQPERRDRAITLLAEAADAARDQRTRVPPVERGILSGLETWVWRMLGQRPRMLDTGRRALQEIASCWVERRIQADDSMTATTAAAVTQAATSLLFADDLDGSRQAYDLLTTIATEQHWPHHANVAASGRAVIDVLEGRLDAARAELAAVRPDAWPADWLDGQEGDLWSVAQGWVHLDDGEPQLALDTLDRLSAHVDASEYWEFVAAVTVYAEAMLGRGAAAEAWLDALSRQRVDELTLPSVRGRLMAARSSVQLSTGTARQWPQRRLPGRASAVAGAMQAIAAAARGEEQEAVALLAHGESGAISPLQHALVAVAGITVAQRTDSGLSATGFGIRLATLATAHGLHWPVALLAERDRARVLATVRIEARDTTAEVLASSFAAVPAMVDEQLWRTEQVPPLTPRERDVLRALTTTADRAEIAAELFVSINTVKAQLRSLYAKLGARGRDEALRRAIELGLLVDPVAAGGPRAEAGPD